MKGPLLLATNHPDSFLDAILLDLLFDKPIWSLTRGDAFRGKMISRFLTALKMLPVYRTSEGVGNLSDNYKTFDSCVDIFRKKGLVLIFIEGRCVNEWALRPLKKGTARLAIQTWAENVPLKILPVGINYSSFFRFGKNVFLNFGELIGEEAVERGGADGARIQACNNLIQKQLEGLVYKINKKDKTTQRELLEIKPSLFTRIVLIIPATLGYIINAPFYLPVRNFIHKKTRHSGHYDSIMMGILLVSYPFYLLALTLTAYFISGKAIAFFLFLVIPFTAWSYIRLKPQLDK